MIASHIGLNPETQRQMLAGEPACRPRAARHAHRAHPRRRLRARRHPDPTGIGTVVEEGKQKIAVDGRDYLLEPALRADFALVHAFIADYLGNLSYALTARNFNPLMAMAADTVVVQAENIVPVGVVSPDHVVTPAPVVDYLS